LVLAPFARKGVASRPIFSWGFFIGGNRTDEIQNQAVRIGLSNVGCAKRRTGALRLWLALFSLVSIRHAGACANAKVNAASGSQDAAAVPHSFTDEMGRKVEVPTAVKRIVFARSEPHGNRVCFRRRRSSGGDTVFCDYPPKPPGKPRVGGPINPNLEQVVALAPDLVLATKAINRRETVEALARIGLPVFVTDPHSVEDMIASVEHIGNVFARRKTAAPLAEDLRRTAFPS